MTHRRFAFVLGVFVVLSLARPAQAQDIDLSQFDPQTWFKSACPTCGVHGYLDYPKTGASLMRSTVLMAGWGFECVSGRAIDRIDVWYEPDDFPGAWLPLKQADGAARIAAVNRPDVSAAYERACPNAPGNAGWWLLLTNPPPAGARRIMLKLWSGPYHADLVRTYSFLDR